MVLESQKIFLLLLFLTGYRALTKEFETSIIHNKQAVVASSAFSTTDVASTGFAAAPDIHFANHVALGGFVDFAADCINCPTPDFASADWVTADFAAADFAAADWFTTDFASADCAATDLTAGFFNVAGLAGVVCIAVMR